MTAVKLEDRYTTSIWKMNIDGYKFDGYKFDGSHEERQTSRFIKFLVILSLDIYTLSPQASDIHIRQITHAHVTTTYYMYVNLSVCIYIYHCNTLGNYYYQFCQMT